MKKDGSLAGAIEFGHMLSSGLGISRAQALAGFLSDPVKARRIRPNDMLDKDLQVPVMR
jgi:hypothetical protein